MADTEQDKMDRRVAEIRHTEVTELLKAIAFPGYVPESIKKEREQEFEKILQQETQQYKITDNEKSTD